MGSCLAQIRRATPLLLAAVVVILAGCTTTATVPPYDDLVSAMPGEPLEPSALRQAFLARADFDERLSALMALEAQVLASLDERPLRLGAVGSAILDLYYGSLAGHQALARFYTFVDSPEQAAYHERWIAAIRADIEASGDGSLDAPYRVLFVNQAKGYLVTRGLTMVGSAYQQTQSHPFMLWAAARPESGRMQDLHFDLTGTYQAYERAIREDEATMLPVAGPPLTCRSLGMCEALSTSAFVQLLAGGEDSAAQVLIGRTLARRADRFEDAAQWLLQAAQSENALANLSLGELCVALAYSSGRQSVRVWLERAERRFLLAASAGFDTAMVQLGRLYLVGEYGADKRPPGIELLERAAELDNVDALRDLAGLHVEGPPLVDRDLDAAEAYFLRAAELDDESKIDYARFLVQPGYGRSFNDRAYGWLREAAKADNPRGMLLLAQLFHTGSHVDQSTRRARSWFKRAVKVAPDDPFVVNQAAWTLTVTRLPRLRDPRYAVKIMDRVMADENGEARDDPAYLDTWAAAYAAIGNFERAITIQQEAIAKEQARSDRQRRNTLPILLEHLAAFRAGERISDEAIP